MAADYPYRTGAGQLRLAFDPPPLHIYTFLFLLTNKAGVYSRIKIWTYIIFPYQIDAGKLKCTTAIETYAGFLLFF